MEKALEEMRKEVHEVKKLLMGNGKVGVAEMARRSFEWMAKCKASKNGLLDWAFRIGISIIVTYIAISVGVK